MNESQLIEQYAASRSDDVFRALVDQYVGLVYSACFRQLRDRHLAEDATQAVFILLSQKAGGVRSAYLSGWLLTTSRYACANIRRSERRRQRREQVVAMKQSATTSETPGSDLIDQLDDALCHLKAGDREALVLRYLKERPMAEIAGQLGVSEEAARKRVERGMGKLRKYFLRRGVAATPVSLGPILAEQLRGAMLNTALRQTITQNVLQVCFAGSHCTAASVAIAKGTNTMMMLAKVKTAAAVALLLGGLGTTGWAISRAVAESSPAAQTPAIAAAAPAPVAQSPVAESPSAESPAAVPAATQPAIDLSTPQNTFKSVIIALRSGDPGTLNRCLVADATQDPLPIDRLLAWDLAVNRSILAAKQAYGPGAGSMKMGRTIDDVLEMMGVSGPASYQGTGSGATAELFVQIPAALLALAPPTMKPTLSEWSGAPIEFKKVGNDWKLDIDQSMKVEMQIGSGAAPQERQTQRDAAILQDMTDSFSELAEDIASGQLPTMGDAMAELKNTRRHMRSMSGVSGNVAIAVLPVHLAAVSTTEQSGQSNGGGAGN
jgi:RNA polymerase sigma factor (sigma-70 family)